MFEDPPSLKHHAESESQAAAPQKPQVPLSAGCSLIIIAGDPTVPFMNWVYMAVILGMLSAYLVKA